MRSFRIAQAELKRLVSARPFRLAAAVVCVVPLLYGVLYLWAFWNPYARLDKLPVAVVNLDQPVSPDGATVHVGSDLVGSLLAQQVVRLAPGLGRAGARRSEGRHVHHGHDDPRRLQR